MPVAQRKNPRNPVKVVEWRKKDGEFNYHAPITGLERQMDVTLPLGGNADLRFSIAEMDASHMEFYFSLSLNGVDLMDKGVSGLLSRDQLLSLPRVIDEAFSKVRGLGMLQ